MTTAPRCPLPHCVCSRAMPLPHCDYSPAMPPTTWCLQPHDAPYHIVTAAPKCPLPHCDYSPAMPPTTWCFQPRDAPYHIEKEDLASRLQACLCASPEFAPFCLPLLLEKLISSVLTAKMDALRTLVRSGGERRISIASNGLPTKPVNIPVIFKYTVFDLISEHALISGPPPILFSFFFSSFFYYF